MIFPAASKSRIALTTPPPVLYEIRAASCEGWILSSCPRAGILLAIHQYRAESFPPGQGFHAAAPAVNYSVVRMHLHDRFDIAGAVGIIANQPPRPSGQRTYSSPDHAVVRNAFMAAPTDAGSKHSPSLFTPRRIVPVLGRETATATHFKGRATRTRSEARRHSALSIRKRE